MRIRSTIELATASTKDWDIAVIGAGPAGAMAARELARLGHEVLLVDKADFPRTKVCGCCLNANGQAILQTVGLGDLPSELGAVQIDQFRIAGGKQQATIPITGTVSVSRLAFDAALVEQAISAGAHFLPQTEARLAGITGDFRQLKLRNYSSEHCKLNTRVLLAADGVGSGLMNRPGEIDSNTANKSRIGAGIIVNAETDGYEPGTIYMACGRDGYVGLVRLQNGGLDIAAALDRNPIKQAGGIGQLADQIMRDAMFPVVPKLEQMKWQGTPLLTRRANKPFAQRTFLIGDAAGYVEPFTGEGISWALACGSFVAPIASRAVEQWNIQRGNEWADCYARIVGNRQWVCRLLAKGLRFPRLTTGAVNLVGRFPILAKPITRALTSPRNIN